MRDNLVFTINVDEICPNDLIGDGHKVGNIKDAITEAYEVARKL